MKTADTKGRDRLELPQIEITPAMIEAGAECLADLGEVNNFVRAARDVYLAMERARVVSISSLRPNTSVQQEIEITPAMLDAGFEVLLDADYWGRGEVNEDVIRNIFMVMLSAAELAPRLEFEDHEDGKPQL